MADNVELRIVLVDPDGVAASSAQASVADAYSSAFENNRSTSSLDSFLQAAMAVKSPNVAAAQKPPGAQSAEEAADPAGATRTQSPGPDPNEGSSPGANTYAGSALDAFKAAMAELTAAEAQVRNMASSAKQWMSQNSGPTGGAQPSQGPAGQSFSQFSQQASSGGSGGPGGPGGGSSSAGGSGDIEGAVREATTAIRDLTGAFTNYKGKPGSAGQAKRNLKKQKKPKGPTPQERLQRTQARGKQAKGIMQAGANAGSSLIAGHSLQAFTSAAGLASEALMTLGPAGAAAGVALDVFTTSLNAIGQVIDAVVARGAYLARYSGELQDVRSQATVRQIQGDIRETEALSPGIASVTDSSSQITDMLREILLPIQKFMVEELAEFLEFVKDFMQFAKPALTDTSITLATILEVLWDIVRGKLVSATQAIAALPGRIAKAHKDARDPKKVDPSFSMTNILNQLRNQNAPANDANGRPPAWLENLRRGGVRPAFAGFGHDTDYSSGSGGDF